MEREQILRQLMREKNMKVSDIAKITGIAYSTIKSIFENGLEKTSYINVRKICAALDITPDKLEEMAHTEKVNVPYEPTYEDMQKLIARNGKKLSFEEKMELIKLLSELR